ncbi:inositol monophosphatase family protein [Brevibacterium litoralis]|uniref:inositol monophosphatase family protein n=1 Tax=Brevibacterium litoralis TaxID=3138935 RepID=UPI0032EAF879
MPSPTAAAGFPPPSPGTEAPSRTTAPVYAGPISAPLLPEATDPVLAAACRAAASAAVDAWAGADRATLAAEARMGADGTPTMEIDVRVEDAILAVAEHHRVNLLSEEVGFVDHGSARTLVVDPLDGSANAAAGVPLSCFSGVLVEDDTPVEALNTWLETGRSVHARAGGPTVDGTGRVLATSGRSSLDGAALSMLRPKVGERGDTMDTWVALTRRAGRIRVLSTSCLESMLVATGAIDVFADAGSDTHRLVDVYAAAVFAPAAGGAVLDAFGRTIEFDTDLTRRYSGVVAATPALAEEVGALIAQIQG